MNRTRYIVRKDFTRSSVHTYFNLVDTATGDVLDCRKRSRKHEMYKMAWLLNEAFRNGYKFTPEQHWQLSKHYISRYIFTNFRDAHDYHAMWKKAYKHFKLSGKPYMPQILETIREKKE